MRKQNVAYLRVSTEAQTEKYGLDMQKQKILEYCEKEKITIDEWYIDGGYSGSKLERPEIQRLLDDAERGKIGRVFIYKLDRMSRDVIDTLNLLYRVLPKYGIQVISMTEDLKVENPIDKVVIGLNAMMNQYERDVFYMRTRAGMIERVKKGLWPGGGMVPWGYRYDRNDGILHPEPEEAEMVRRAYMLYRDGYSCDNIAKIVGFKAERVVIQLLKRKSNIGLIEYRGKVYQGLHEPIVDEKLFYEVQECIKRRSNNSYASNDHVLTGLCYCGICGAKMRYQKWGKYYKLVCYSRKTYGKDYLVKNPNCKNSMPKAEEVEREVAEWFKNFVLEVEEGRPQESKAEIIKESIKKSKTKIKKYYSLYAENESENLFELIKEEEDKEKELKKQLEEEEIKEHKYDSNKVDRIKKMAEFFDDCTIKEKNKLLKDCIKRVVINMDKVEVEFIDF